MEKIQKGDLVEVISGKDKGIRGTVKSVNLKKRQLLVGGVNLVIFHKKPSSDSPGERLKKELPIDICKVMLIDPQLGQPTRVGIRWDENGNKIRFSKKTNAPI